MWNNDKIANPTLPSPKELEWELKEDEKARIPITTTLPPVPDAVVHLVRCKCVKERSRTNRCQCRKAGLKCTDLCGCSDSGDECENVLDSDDEDDHDDEMSVDEAFSDSDDSD